MSGYLATAEVFRLSPEAVTTPVAHFHGKIDPTVRVELARESARRVRELGVKEYVLTVYDREILGHSAGMDEIAGEIADILKWLAARLPAHFASHPSWGGR